MGGVTVAASVLTVVANGCHPKTSSPIKVNPNLGDCDWTAVSNDGFITITDGASGTGKVTAAGETFTVTQAGVK